MPGTDDLAGLMQPPPQGEGLRYAQGKITAWDPDTFENTIDVRGAVLRNVPILNGTEALTYQVGDVVSLMGWAPKGGASSWTILGRLFIPGAGAGEAAVDFLRTTIAAQIVDELVEELLVSPAGQQLAAFVFASRVHSDTVGTAESTTSTTYGDLATAGPAVSGVEVSDSGTAIVFISANENNGGVGGVPTMSIQVSGGPTAVAPTDLFPLQHNAVSTQLGVTTTYVYVLELDPGTYTFTAKFRSQTGSSVNFAARSIVVFGL